MLDYNYSLLRFLMVGVREGMSWEGMSSKGSCTAMFILGIMLYIDLSICPSIHLSIHPSSVSITSYRYIPICCKALMLTVFVTSAVVFLLFVSDLGFTLNNCSEFQFHDTCLYFSSLSWTKLSPEEQEVKPTLSLSSGKVVGGRTTMLTWLSDRRGRQDHGKKKVWPSGICLSGTHTHTNVGDLQAAV